MSQEIVRKADEVFANGNDHQRIIQAELIGETTHQVTHLGDMDVVGKRAINVSNVIYDDTFEALAFYNNGLWYSFYFNEERYTVGHPELLGFENNLSSVDCKRMARLVLAQLEAKLAQDKQTPSNFRFAAGHFVPGQNLESVDQFDVFQIEDLKAKLQKMLLKPQKEGLDVRCYTKPNGDLKYLCLRHCGSQFWYNLDAKKVTKHTFEYHLSDDLNNPDKKAVKRWSYKVNPIVFGLYEWDLYRDLLLEFLANESKGFFQSFGANFLPAQAEAQKSEYVFEALDRALAIPQRHFGF